MNQRLWSVGLKSSSSAPRYDPFQLPGAAPCCHLWAVSNSHPQRGGSKTPEKLTWNTRKLGGFIDVSPMLPPFSRFSKFGKLMLGKMILLKRVSC